LTRKNRDSLKIVAAILNVCSNYQGVCKTRIMIQANLNFNLLEKYLKKAVDLNLVKLQDKNYFLTVQGQEFLRKYEQFQRRYISAQELFIALDDEYQELVKTLT
jgi:predicted transcriptional regulator